MSDQNPQPGRNQTRLFAIIFAALVVMLGPGYFMFLRADYVILYSDLRNAEAAAIVTELDRRGFGIASGSACTASTLTPSHVLEAMGVLTHGNVRLSLQRATQRADVDAFCDVLPGVVAEIRSRVGL